MRLREKMIAEIVDRDHAGGQLCGLPDEGHDVRRYKEHIRAAARHLACQRRVRPHAPGRQGAHFQVIAARQQAWRRRVGDVQPPAMIGRRGQRDQVADDLQRIAFGAGALGAHRT